VLLLKINSYINIPLSNTGYLKQKHILHSLLLCVSYWLALNGGWVTCRQPAHFVAIEFYVSRAECLRFRPVPYAPVIPTSPDFNSLLVNRSEFPDLLWLCDTSVIWVHPGCDWEMVCLWSKFNKHHHRDVIVVCFLPSRASYRYRTRLDRAKFIQIQWNKTQITLCFGELVLSQAMTISVFLWKKLYFRWLASQLCDMIWHSRKLLR